MYNPTPEERAEEYRVMQDAQFAQFTSGFKDDYDSLLEPLDVSQKEKELEMIRKQELQKVERQVKKDLNEWEDLFAGNASLSKNAKGLSQLGDKIAKIMEGNLKKTMRKGILSDERRIAFQANQEVVQTELDKNMKSIKMLEALSKALGQKNFELYLKHEVVLDANRKERAELAN